MNAQVDRDRIYYTNVYVCCEKFFFFEKRMVVYIVCTTASNILSGFCSYFYGSFLRWSNMLVHSSSILSESPLKIVNHYHEK